jgi:hypothetical protein
MSPNRNNVAGESFAYWQPHLAVCLLALAGFASSPASATTEAETTLFNFPMPHEKLDAGRSSVKVHWMQRHGYFEGTISVDELKADVQNCVQLAQAAHLQTRPPKTWPDHVQSTRNDSYDAANRTITYSTTLMYSLNQSDCSLREDLSAVARLASDRGWCDIDLINKKAHGNCNANAHADAPAVVHTGPRAPAPYRQTGASSAPTQAAVAAMEKAMRQFGPGKGGFKTIAGIGCDVLTHVLGTQGTYCISRGGAFQSWSAGPSATGASMNLEVVSVGGVNSRAVKAQLDSTINAAVFAPYLADGFQVTNIKRVK